MRRLTVLALILMTGSLAWGNAAEKAALARVVLTTEARLVAGCDRLGLVSDDEVEDLRKKIVRTGGDTGLLSFDTDDLDRIHAEIYRCQKGAVPAPTAAVAPPPGAAPGRRARAVAQAPQRQLGRDAVGGGGRAAETVPDEPAGLRGRRPASVGDGRRGQ